MFLKRSFLIVSMASVMFLQGCGVATPKEDTKVEATNNKVTFRLAEKLINSEFKGHDGEVTEFFGYMSIDHLDSDYIIVTFNPEGLCPFHGDVTTDEYRAIPVKLKEGYVKPENLYLPVKVDGVIKAGEFKDGEGHNFELIIEDAVLTSVDSSRAEGVLKSYIKLAEKGIFEKIRTQQVAIDEALGYNIFGLELEDLKHIDIGSLEYVKEIALSVQDGSVDDLITCIDSAIDLGVAINEIIDKGDLTLLVDDELVTKAYKMFEMYQRWQLKYSV